MKQTKIPRPDVCVCVLAGRPSAGELPLCSHSRHGAEEEEEEEGKGEPGEPQAGAGDGRAQDPHRRALRPTRHRPRRGTSHLVHFHLL